MNPLYLNQISYISFLKESTKKNLILKTNRYSCIVYSYKWT